MRELALGSRDLRPELHRSGRRRMAPGGTVWGSPVSSSTTAFAAEAPPTHLLQPTGRRHAHQRRVTTNGQASTSGDSSSRSLSSRGKSSTRAWQHQWRYMRSEKERANRSLPKIDWNRYHLQVSVWHTHERSAHTSCARSGRLTISLLLSSSESCQTVMQPCSRNAGSCIFCFNQS